MICLSVSRNGQELCVAGHAEAELLTSHVSGATTGECAVSLDVTGMCELPDDRAAHLRWIDLVPLSSGDILEFKLLESSTPSPPSALIPTDSPEYLAEQAEFSKLEAEWVPPSEEPPIRWPNIQFVFKINDGSPLRVRIPAGQQHVLCSFLWDKWRPETCRVFARTFSGGAVDVESRKTDWMRAALMVGDVLSIKISF